MSHERTTVYTDGACLGNPGPGGWAWAVPEGPFASGAAPRTTNQRMELTAVLEALHALPGPLEVVSDSTYVVNCFRDRWWEGWLRSGWRNSRKEPVANRDLWAPLVELVRQREEISFRWVKGHGSDPMNALVDRLAVQAATEQQGRRDGHVPARPAPEAPAPAAAAATAQQPGASGGRDRRLPPGTLVLVAGLRAPDLGGYEENPTAARARARIGEALDALVSLHGPVTVVSGLRLGAEQLGAEAAVRAGLPLVVVLPYPEPDSLWPPASRERFERLAGGARDRIVLERKAPATKQHARQSLARRDAWLARNVDAAVVVWDGDDEVVGRLVRSLEERLPDGEVIVIGP